MHTLEEIRIKDKVLNLSQSAKNAQPYSITRCPSLHAGQLQSPSEQGIFKDISLVGHLIKGDFR